MKVLRKIFVSSCVIFSILILVICSGLALIGTPEGFGFDHAVVFALFILSFVISCTNAIYYHTKLNEALKYILHLFVILASSAIFLKIVNGLPGKTVLVAVIIIAILHGGFFIALGAIKKSMNKNGKYENVYSRNDS